MAPKCMNARARESVLCGRHSAVQFVVPFSFRLVVFPVLLFQIEILYRLKTKVQYSKSRVKSRVRVLVSRSLVWFHARLWTTF